MSKSIRTSLGLVTFKNVQGVAVQAWETGLLVTPVSEGLENMILEHMGSLVSTVSRRRILDTWFLEIFPNDKNGHDMLDLVEYIIKFHNQIQ